MNFKNTMKIKQVTWRKKSLPYIIESGFHNGKQYDYILPRHSLQHNFYPFIYNELFNSATGYISRNKIHPHTGIHNLLSSWVLCVNLYWPFRNKDGFLIFKEYLNEYLKLDIKEICSMDLEYEDDLLPPDKVLGESAGSRGNGQTSPDLAITFVTKDGSNGILLIESKFTEHDFYPCAGYKKLNPDKNRCLNTNLICSSNFNECNLQSWSRKYWSLLQGDLDTSKFNSLRKCPFVSSTYQLFRQQALAKALSKKFEISISCVAADSRNLTLINSTCKLGLSPLPKGWTELFPNINFQWLTHNDWYRFVKKNNRNGRWDSWIDYVEDRYFL